MDGCDGRGVRRDAGGQGDVLADVGLGETGERDPPRHTLARQLRQGGTQRVAQGRVDVAVGANHQQAAVSQPAREELEEQE